VHVCSLEFGSTGRYEWRGNDRYHFLVSLFKEKSVAKIVKVLSQNCLEMRVFLFASMGQSPFIMCTESH